VRAIINCIFDTVSEKVSGILSALTKIVRLQLK